MWRPDATIGPNGRGFEPAGEVVVPDADGSALVGRAAELVPVLRVRPEHTVELLAEAGLFRLRVPRRYGGYDCDTRTLVGVAAELGRAGGAAAWMASGYWGPTWLATMFGARARDEVFGTPGVLVCGTPSVASTAVWVDGGIVVDGRWEFVAGAVHAEWQVAVSVVVPPAGGEPFPVVALVSVADLTVETRDPGTVAETDGATTVAKELFVPAHQVVALSAVADWRSVPVSAVWAASSVGALLGAAFDARDWYFEDLTTDGGSSRAMSHVQTMDALTMITDAERVAYRLATLVDTGAGAWWSGDDSVRARADLVEVCRLTRDAAYLLAAVHGSPQLREVTRALETGSHRTLTDFDAGAALTGWYRGPR
ncbi:acyl-CoA dehydrogenase family protein [Actinophytocola oryzae]|uniref:Alkylation response protein AidB-like acyl-CoA dehydrogenase n=1 Tax=Actinophytocola oryzae TaxID=502181 RepID=A0A4R7V0U4_9PSEU|nr:acyl-CoA dehydrogenase family protein [Actinophytocola oryzae]TDV41026.1 alkylation response protein AidB-like acyl-CoA dehydrogenase [Actinophytocola oryzae]